MHALQPKLIVPIIHDIENWPNVRAMPSHDGDFVPELHRARSVQMAARLFGEEMSKKTSNTADAKQKRGS